MSALRLGRKKEGKGVPGAKYRMAYTMGEFRILREKAAKREDNSGTGEGGREKLPREYYKG